MFRWELAERRVERFVLSHASAVLPANDDYLEFAVRAGASRKACTVVRYGNLISAAHFVPPEDREEGWSLLNRWGIEPGTPLLLCVGRLEKLKRSEDVIDVSLKLWNQGRQFRCLIVGEGSDEDRLNEKINALGLNGVVVLCRNQSQEWLSRVLPCASAFVSPLTGRALTEAALAAVPVAAYAVDWQAELIIDGETGILAPLGDTAALARGVERLVDNPSHAAAMGRALRTKAMSMMEPSELNRVESSVYLDLVPPRHGATSREALTRVDQF